MVGVKGVTARGGDTSGHWDSVCDVGLLGTSCMGVSEAARPVLGLRMTELEPLAV